MIRLITWALLGLLAGCARHGLYRQELQIIGTHPESAQNIDVAIAPIVCVRDGSQLQYPFEDASLLPPGRFKIQKKIVWECVSRPKKPCLIGVRVTLINEHNVIVKDVYFDEKEWDWQIDLDNVDALENFNTVLNGCTKTSIH